MKPYQRVLLVLGILIALAVVSIYMLPGESHGAELPKSNAAVVIRRAQKDLLGPGDNSVENRFLAGVSLLFRGDAWEPKARTQLTVVAIDANRIAQAMAPFTEPQAPYSSYVIGRACFVQANSKLYYALSVMRILKGREVAGRTYQETSSAFDEVVVAYRCAAEALVEPATRAQFKKELGSERAADNKINELREIIRKNIFRIQQAQQGMGDKKNQQNGVGGEDEKKILRAILGDTPGEKSKDVQIVPSQPSTEPGEKKYAPGAIGGT